MADPLKSEYSILKQIICKMIFKFTNENHWAMSKEDLKMEMWCVILRIQNTYDDIEGEEFIKLCIRSMSNKLNDMLRMYFYRLRKIENTAISLDLDEDDSQYINPPYVPIEPDDFLCIRTRLLEVDRPTLDVLIGNIPKAEKVLRLISRRNGMQKIPYPYFISRSLNISIKEANDSLQRIRKELRKK